MPAVSDSGAERAAEREMTTVFVGLCVANAAGFGVEKKKKKNERNE